MNPPSGNDINWGWGKRTAGDIEGQALQFLVDRARHILIERDGFAYDEVNAAFAASADDLVFNVSNSAFEVKGDPDAAVGLAKLAAGERLYVHTIFTAAGATFPFGTHVAVAEVDTQTGKAVLRSVLTVDDAGIVLNPLLAEGQRHGGIAQGAAQAFLEEVVYDSDGNPLTASFADYPIVSATELPSFDLVTMETPTSYNPLGAKGIGEAGTIGATPAVQSAIVDAVAHLGVRHIDMPASPMRIWRAIQAASSTEGA